MPGDTIRGTYREAIQLASGRCALVENAQEFTLVPWRPVIARSLGREIVGLVTEGGISWQIGRDLPPGRRQAALGPSQRMTGLGSE
ncbi:MAG: DUF3363 domain-containing protein [Acidibrevibacterium sp.]|uniref:DUF3363 domain-containing protein n=1 Tax=Acidibrevibacterium fodinaquatile TaxID=1969806 RepID=UPI0023A837DE|nr:DUF3363 domain-containing protein [Acidibrevibacterium fodinaquatile]MCA7117910.1 DUF3363 domain-containing protein [Acidibrevibacterium fodinaquatile]